MAHRTSCQVTREATVAAGAAAVPRDEVRLIGAALTRVYGTLPDDALPERLQRLVDRLHTALADRR